MINGGMDAKMPERIDLLPAQFNIATTLHGKVDPKANVFDFELK